jgi:WD40 repeat protein
MLVYGVSGTGKSSLIHCGLANKFSETDWLPLVIRRGNNMIESMAAGISSASLTKQQSKFNNPVDFKKGVRSLYLDHYKPVFFIFDQFEELFIFGDKDERSSFVSIVKLLTESGLQCRFIFVMREEYMASISEFEKYISTIFSNRVRIEKMSHINALEAIKGPCKVFNINLEEGFAEALLEKLSPASQDVELTYLQVFLDKIFKLAIKESETNRKPDLLFFTLSLLDKIGNVSDLLGSFLDVQISLMESPETALLILKSMVSIQGTKRQLNTEEIKENLESFGTSIEMTMLQEMLQIFINLRILREKDDNGKMELRHDALAAKIFEKFTMAEKELLEVRKYVENAHYNFEKRGILLNKLDLEYLDEYENKLILPTDLQEFVDHCKQKFETSKKALKRITRVSTVIFIIILAIVLRFYISTQFGTDPKEMFAAAISVSASDPVKGLIEELKLWELDSTSTQLYGLILRDFNRVVSANADTSDQVFLLQEYLKPVKLESQISNSEISKTGQIIFGWMNNQKVFIYETATGKISLVNGEGSIKRLEISESNRSIALLYTNNAGSVFSFSGDKYFSFETTLGGSNDGKLMTFFTSGNEYFAVVKDKKVSIYDKSGRIIYELQGHTENINSIDISSDGRFIVTVSDDKHGLIWNYNPEIKEYSVYDSLVGHKDKIWSGRFNKSGKYLITASADSTIKIWNLNGEQINPEMRFLLGSGRYRFNNGEPDEDMTDPQYAAYYGKFSDAWFSPGEFEIIATCYSDESEFSDESESYLQKVIFYDWTGGIYRAFGRSGFISEVPDSTIQMQFSEIVISPDEKTAAVVGKTNSEISVFAGFGEIIIVISGTDPMFSKDGGTLYWISDNEILRIPINPKEIRLTMEKFNITSTNNSEKNIRLKI